MYSLIEAILKIKESHTKFFEQKAFPKLFECLQLNLEGARFDFDLSVKLSYHRSFPVGVPLHSALNPLRFDVIVAVDAITWDFQQRVPWMMLYGDNVILACEELVLPFGDVRTQTEPQRRT